MEASLFKPTLKFLFVQRLSFLRILMQLQLMRRGMAVKRKEWLGRDLSRRVRDRALQESHQQVSTFGGVCILSSFANSQRAPLQYCNRTQSRSSTSFGEGFRRGDKSTKQRAMESSLFLEASPFVVMVCVWCFSPYMCKQAVRARIVRSSSPSPEENNLKQQPKSREHRLRRTTT